jgi:superfamily II DNA or RNA helicase
LVTSKVLNEGVDVPEAKIAIVLSGTGSSREYVQRLGRILRRGEGKLALLYEVIAEDTSEEGVSRRRRETPGAASAPSQTRSTVDEAQSRLFAPISADDSLSLDEL